MSTNITPKEGKYIVAKGYGGFANRVLALTTAILYAQISRRKLVIDWTDGFYSPPGVNAFPLFFDCSYNHGLDVLPQTQSVYPEIWRGRLSESVVRLREQYSMAGIGPLSLNVADLSYDQDVVVFCAYSQLLYRMRHLFKEEFSYLRSLKENDLLKKIICEEIVLNQKLMKNVKCIVAENFEPNNVGVHIRYTDIQISLDKVHSTVEKIINQKTPGQIFLTTDSRDVETEFRSRFDNVLTMEKWFPPSGRRLHQNFEECPDRVQNGVEALKDLYLLSYCESIIYSSRSAFGFMATLLSSSDQCYNIERVAASPVTRVVWRLLDATRPTRRRFGLTKSAIRHLVISRNSGARRA